MDFRSCQTSIATPAEPGGLPFLARAPTSVARGRLIEADLALRIESPFRASLCALCTSRSRMARIAHRGVTYGESNWRHSYANFHV